MTNCTGAGFKGGAGSILSKTFHEIIVAGNRAGQNVAPFFLCVYIATMENYVYLCGAN